MENEKPDPPLDLADLARSFAELSPAFRSTRIELHTVDIRDSERSITFLRECAAASFPRHPSALAICTIKDFKVFTSVAIPYVKDANTIGWVNRIDELTLPTTSAIFIGSPVVHTDSTTNDSLATEAISQVRALIVSAFGRAVLLARAATFFVSADKGEVSFVSPVFRTPQALDFRAAADPGLLSEIAFNQKTAKESDQVALRQAFDFCGRAAVETDEAFRFTLYWLALEVAAGGKSDAIAARLGQAYGASKTFAYENLGLRSIADARHDFLHRGVRPDLTHVVERSMQAYLIDLARWRLGLHCVRFAESIRAGV